MLSDGLLTVCKVAREFEFISLRQISQYLRDFFAYTVTAEQRCSEV